MYWCLALKFWSGTYRRSEIPIAAKRCAKRCPPSHVQTMHTAVEVYHVIKQLKKSVDISASHC